MTTYNIGKYGSAFRRLVATAAAVALFATQLSLDVAAQTVSAKGESVAYDLSGKADKALQGPHLRCEIPLTGVAGNSLRG